MSRQQHAFKVVRVVAVAAGLATVAAGAAWYRRRRAKAQLMAPPGSCCEAKEAAVGVDGHMRAPLEPLSAQLVLHLRARLASPSATPRTSASAATAPGDDPLRLCGVSDAWIAAVHRLVHSNAYDTEGSNLAAPCY